MFPHLLIDSSRNSVMVVNADTMSEAWSMGTQFGFDVSKVVTLSEAPGYVLEVNFMGLYGNQILYEGGYYEDENK